jgi:hypothetical protein
MRVVVAEVVEGERKTENREKVAEIGKRLIF